MLCLPPQQVTAKQLLNEHSENELRKKRASLFNPVKDLRKIQSTYKDLSIKRNTFILFVCIHKFSLIDGNRFTETY